MAVTNSSTLLSKLENINWCYSLNTSLQSTNSTLLVKYIIEENAYAIMVSDFVNTYFECLIGEQIEHHYSRFNNKSKRISYQVILEYLTVLLQDLRESNSLSLEKLDVDDHTSRITIKIAKFFDTLKLNWNFYIISTDPEIFMKHFTLPVWRGLVHFYRLSQSQNSHANNDTNEANTEQQQNHFGELASLNNFPPFPFDDSLLNDLFR